MELDLKDLEFSDLSTNLLYEILKLRSAVFVVEQTCVYQDMDDKDSISLHVVGMIKNEVITYARIVPDLDRVSIGRVITKENYRGKNLGYETMNYCLKVCQDKWPGKEVQLSSQKHLLNFYEKFGFKKEGKPYLEDGIPHILMKLETI